MAVLQCELEITNTTALYIDWHILTTGSEYVWKCRMDYNTAYVVTMSLQCVNLIHSIVVEYSEQHIILR